MAHERVEIEGEAEDGPRDHEVAGALQGLNVLRQLGGVVHGVVDGRDVGEHEAGDQHEDIKDAFAEPDQDGCPAEEEAENAAAEGQRIIRNVEEGLVVEVGGSKVDAGEPIEQEKGGRGEVVALQTVDPYPRSMGFHEPGFYAGGRPSSTFEEGQRVENSS